MSKSNADILAKLKIKNIPVSKERLDIIIPAKQPMEKETIELKTKVVDKTKFAEFDRESFLKMITGIASTISPVVIAGPGPLPVPFSEPIQKEVKVKPKKKIVIQEEVVETVETAKPVETSKPVDTAKPANEDEEEEIVIKRIVKKKPKPPVVGVILEGPTSMLKIGDADINTRVKPKEPSVLVSASSYYMSNREIFTNFMSSLFGKYKNELLTESAGATCDYDPDAPFSLMTHQKIVRDYLNLYTPYRGLLLFHGLGSGKTCSSIAIAEGMKSGKRIIVMTPASLRMNFIEELKKCGDELYHKNQFWEFIDTTVEPELVETLSRVLSLSVEFIRKAGGAWMVNMKKPSNFDAIQEAKQDAVDARARKKISDMGYAKGGKVSSASSRADGIASKGKTKGTMIAMCGGGMYKK